MTRLLSEPPSDDADLAAAIDASFGDGPPLPPTDVLLQAGRRARRRRTTNRVALGGAVAAGVMVAATASVGGWDLTGASGIDGGVASTPSSPPPATTGEDEPPPVPTGQQLGIGFGPQGELRTREGTTVVRQEDGPLEDTGQDRSYALVVQREGQRYWVIAEWSPAGELVSSDPAGKGFATFDDWVDHRVEATTGEERGLVELSDDGSLVPAPGVELLAQEQGLDLGERFAGPSDRTAAAEVIDGERRWYVLVRDSSDGPPDYIKVAPAATAPTFRGFLRMAAELYSGQSEDSGEGLR